LPTDSLWLLLLLPMLLLYLFALDALNLGWALVERQEAPTVSA
jgi:hypothetical protein